MRYKDEIPVFLLLDMHVQNKKYGNFVFISRSTRKCATHKFCSSSPWSCLHHMVILKRQNEKKRFFDDFSLIVSLKAKFVEVNTTLGPIG